MLRIMLVKAGRWCRKRDWKMAAIQFAAWSGFVEVFGAGGAVLMLYRFGRDQLENAGIPVRSSHVRLALAFVAALFALLFALFFWKGELLGFFAGILFLIVAVIVLAREVNLARLERAAETETEESET